MAISRKMSPNRRREMAISAMWKAMERPWLTTLAPILMSFSRGLVSDQSRMASGVAKIVRERVQLKPDRVGIERAARKPRPFVLAVSQDPLSPVESRLVRF